MYQNCKFYISDYSEYVFSSSLSIYFTLIALWCCFPIQLLISIYNNNGAEMQICPLLTRIQCKVSDAQVTVKACWPLVILISPSYITSSCWISAAGSKYNNLAKSIYSLFLCWEWYVRPKIWGNTNKGIYMHTWLICHILRWCRQRAAHILKLRLRIREIWRGVLEGCWDWTSEKFKGRGSCRPLVHAGSKSLPLAAESVCVEPRVRCTRVPRGLPRGLEV